MFTKTHTTERIPTLFGPRKCIGGFESIGDGKEFKECGNEPCKLLPNIPYLFRCREPLGDGSYIQYRNLYITVDNTSEYDELFSIRVPSKIPGKSRMANYWSSDYVDISIEAGSKKTVQLPLYNYYDRSIRYEYFSYFTFMVIPDYSDHVIELPSDPDHPIVIPNTQWFGPESTFTLTNPVTG